MRLLHATMLLLFYFRGSEDGIIESWQSHVVLVALLDFVYFRIFYISEIHIVKILKILTKLMMMEKTRFVRYTILIIYILLNNFW